MNLPSLSSFTPPLELAFRLMSVVATLFTEGCDPQGDSLPSAADALNKISLLGLGTPMDGSVACGRSPCLQLAVQNGRKPICIAVRPNSAEIDAHKASGEKMRRIN